MRITQAFVGVAFFREQFLKKWELKNYNNPFKPAIFFGLYRKQWHILKSHHSLAVIIWAGSDILQVKNNPEIIRFLRKRSNTYFIAISNFIENDLKSIQLPFKSIPITPIKYIKPTPFELGKNIYMYSAHRKKEFYGEHYLKHLKRKFPKLNFIIAYHDSFTQKELKQIYKSCFIGLRLTKHDGLSNTAIELGMMGIKVIWNGNSPNSIPYKKVDDIVSIIKREQKNIGKINRDLAKDVYKYVNIGKDWLDTNYYTTDFKVQKIPITIKKKQGIMSTKYKASVIINTVNEDKKYLQQAINSYKNQKNVDMQIIISTVIGDTSIELAKKNKCDLHINNKHGIYLQLNNAIKLIENEWFCYASGNDIALPNKLFFEINKCMQTEKKICYSNFYHCNDKLDTIKKTNFYEYDIRKHLQGNFVNDCAVIHKSILDRYCPFNIEFGNHAYWDFWLRVYKGEGNVFCFNQVPAWKYRITSKSSHVIRSQNAKAREANLQLRYKMLKHHMKILKIKL